MILTDLSWLNMNFSGPNCNHCLAWACLNRITSVKRQEKTQHFFPQSFKSKITIFGRNWSFPGDPTWHSQKGTLSKSLWSNCWFWSRDFDHVKMHTQSGLPHWSNNYLFILRRPIQTHVYCWYYRARNVLYSWWSGQDHVISKLIERRRYCNFRKFFECRIF